MTDNTTFRGSVEVSSTGDGFMVGLTVETDAHDLGHALAAIISCYLDAATRQGAGETEDLKAKVLDGIACALAKPPEFQRSH